MGRPRKNSAKTSVQPSSDDDLALASENQTVSLDFVEANDLAVQPPVKKSKLTQAFQQVFATDDDTVKKTRKRKSTFFVKNTELVVSGLLFCIHLLVPQEYKDGFYVGNVQYTFVPTDTQLHSILSPLARIADRHTTIMDINPDVLDVLASIQASAAYGMELRASLLLKAHLDKQKEQEKQSKQQYNIWSDRYNND